MSSDIALTMRLRLRDKHAASLARKARWVNVVWNYCNETQQKAVRSDRRWLSGFDLEKLVRSASQELPLIQATINRVCQLYDKARRQHRKPWLRWRGKKSLGWVPFKNETVRFDGSAFIFMGERYEPMHMRAGIPVGMTKCGSFSADSKGRWYINVTVEVEASAAVDRLAVGVDLGLKSLATLSDGTTVAAPAFYRQHERVLATAQRARKSKRARNIHAKIANRRRDFLHKASNQIARQYGLIVIGDVSPSRLAQTRFAKSIHDAGWADFKRMLSYKAIMHGGSTLEVSEKLTTQTCSVCGSLPPSRPGGIARLGIREWRCDDCGTVHDRDVNAARNILRVGLNALVEGAAR